MQDKNLTILDFDTAAELARKDPEAFEKYRLNAIETLIAKAPERTRQHLRRLQWRIEQVRKRSPNATVACIRLNQMMWDSFAGQGGLIESLQNTQNSTYNKNRQTLSRAKVLAFSRKDDSCCD